MNSDVTKDMQRSEHNMEMAKASADHQALEAVGSIGTESEREALAFACRLMGQAEMARAVSDFANVSAISKLAEIKKNKMYQRLGGFKHVDAEGKIVNASTWDGFCKALGMSRQKVDEDIRNLNAFGEETLERLNQLGLGYRNMRRLRQIPDEVRETVIQGETVALGDKEEIVALIEEMTAKHAREKQALADKVEHLESERQVDQRLLDDKEKKINQLERDLARDLTPDQAAKKRAERDELLGKELGVAYVHSISALNALSSVCEKILELDDRSDHLEESLYGNLRATFQHALLLGRNHDILPEQLLGVAVDLERLHQVLDGEVV